MISIWKFLWVDIVSRRYLFCCNKCIAQCAYKIVPLVQVNTYRILFVKPFYRGALGW